MTASPIAGQRSDIPPAALGTEPPVPPVEGSDDEEERRRRRRLLLLLFLLGILAFLLGLAIWYLLFRQPLPVIPGIPESQVPRYSTSIYGADRPVGVAVTPSGDRVYVAETGGERVVRIFDGGGNPIGHMLPPAETGNSHVPVYLAIDPLTQEIYVTDRPTGSIYIYDRDGAYQRKFQPVADMGSWQPMGITFAPDGTLYVTALAGDPRVVVFDRAGQVIRTLGEAAGMSFPNGVALDAAGNVYVTDSNNGRLLVFNQSGDIVARVGRGANTGELGLPRGVGIDASGRVFVVDTTGQGAHVFRIYQGEPRLEFLGAFGSQGIGEGEFSYPNGAAIDGRGRIYVTDSGNDRVQVWSY